MIAALQLQAAEGHGYIGVFKTNGTVEYIAVDGIYEITHSNVGLDGIEYYDCVTMVITTEKEEKRYAINTLSKVVTPDGEPIELLVLGTGNLSSDRSKAPKKIHFTGRFPSDGVTPITYKWEEMDSIYIQMNKQDVSYIAGIDTITPDSTRARFVPINVKKKETPIYVYWPGANAEAYNKVKIATKQKQKKVNDNRNHIRYSGDCGTDSITKMTNGVYQFNLKHHPAFFSFLTHNKRLPSVKLRSVTLEADVPIAGTFTFDPKNGIDLNSVEHPQNTITLETPYFFDNNWLHTPRSYYNSQDSTAAYMVVAPQKKAGGENLNLTFTFNVVDTLSLIDTSFVKKFSIRELKPNTFYSFNAEVPDTLFSIVDLGLGDIKYAFRNVEAYFERGPVANYGGKFAYGESNTKNDYSVGYKMDNYRGGAINKEFTQNYDAAYQRWEGCWRMPTTYETDSLLAKCKTKWIEYNGVEGALVTGPSGKRIFLPVDENCNNYWSVDTTKQERSDFYWVDATGDWHYYKQPIIAIQRTDSVVYHDRKEFYNPGFVRGILEYSNDIRSNTSFDGSLMLLRHLGEDVADGENFSISGIIRNVRPWPSAGTSVAVDETGFIFGTDSLSLYFNEDDPSANKVWEDSLFVKDFEANGEGMWMPKDGNHLKIVDGNKSVAPYGGTSHGPDDAVISVKLSGETFLGYLDKEQKYYVREYFIIKNPITGKNDYYYASKASRLKGYYPHTDGIKWFVGDESATFSGHVVGVSSEVVGQVGFILSDSIKSETEYAEPTVETGKFYPADGGVKKDMTFSLTIGKESLQNIKLENKYYFVRAAFKSGSEDKGDVAYDYAPEVKILHPLDTIDLGFNSGMLWANLDIRAQYPENLDSSYLWNFYKDPVNRYVTDIGGTMHDVTFQKWFGQDEGWTFTMPSKAQMQALMDSCKFTAETRFGERVVKVTGINGNALYLPGVQTAYHLHTPFWTSTRPPSNTSMAYWDGCDYSDHGTIRLEQIRNILRVRPVLQTNGKIDNSPIFISTDTVGISDTDRRQMIFFGRLLGITPKIKADHSNGNTSDNPAERDIQRGFVLHDFKGGTHSNTGTFFRDIPDSEQRIDSINGLYTVPLPASIAAEMDANTEYWYRAYIQVKNPEGSPEPYQRKYGIPKKLSPLTISIKDIDWEVHENSADLSSEIVGTIFIKDPATVETGFVYGKTADIERNNGKSTDLNYTFKTNEVITDSIYHVTMPVAKDTVYWVRAYIKADGNTRYSTPRQFGLDYVDMGLPSRTLWANISVGSTYPEDINKYYAIGESDTKSHYHGKTYVDDTLKYVWTSSIPKTYTTNTTKPITLKVKNHGGTTEYEFSYHGAVHENFADRRLYCVDPNFWKHYSGTRNDAAFINWEYQNPLYVEDQAKAEGERKYIDNTKYGNLFVEPNYAEWKELKDNCTWVLATENGVDGYRAVSNINGNSLFFPLNGYRWSTYHGNGSLEWNDETTNNQTYAYFHAADSIMTISMRGSRTESPNFSYPSSSFSEGTSPWFGGHSVRPVARFNTPLTKTEEKLADRTLAYLSTDTVTYLNYRTAVVLQGTYRINKPIASAKTGFVVGDRADVTKTSASITIEDGTGSAELVRNASQYFTVLDKADNLQSDKTYYYRFFVNVGDSTVYALNADTFHLARQLTGNPEWQMYQNTATLHGTVQGIQPHEASGMQAQILVGYNRDLTTGNALQSIDCLSQLSDRVGPITSQFTLTKDTTYYFRTYVYYNGKAHYGDVNAFGYELVDLGLPSKKRWASINIGGYNANTGSYIDPIAQKYGLEAYSNTYRAYASVGSGGENDPAHRLWHNVNRMAYIDEMQELMANTTWTADTLYGCPGVLVTSNINGKTLFLRHSLRYFDSDNHDADYSFSDNSDMENAYYFNVNKTNPSRQGDFDGWHSSARNGQPGCHGTVFLRPIWESSDTLPNTHHDEILIRTDAAKVHPEVDNVTFFGSLLGMRQQHMLVNGGSAYNVYTDAANTHAGFIVGSDTLTTHTYKFKYDFPHNELKSDSVLFNSTANINLFKVDSTYWVRAYVMIDGNYYYGRSIKFERKPSIITGDVDWHVGAQKATLYGNVTGFNASFIKPTETAEGLQDMEEITNSARVGILLGYQNHLTVNSPGVTMHDLGKAVNGDFSITVPYEKDTTYYYRSYIYYNNDYVYADSTNHYGLEFVDLGFKNKMHWASISIGSRYAEDKDSLQQYAWGEIEWEKNRKFTFDDYKFYFATGDDEYNNLGDEIKGSANDAAHTNWNYTWDATTYGGRGRLWSMPSEDDLQMLVDSCVWTDSISHAYNRNTNTYDEVKGYKVTGPNGRYIFISKGKLPEWTISGYHGGENAYRPGPWEYGALWTSSRAPRDRNAFGMEVGNKDDNMSKRLMKYHYRYHGHNVRPIAYINVDVGGKKYSITTERTSWVAGAEKATIYGCVLGLDAQHTGSYGFVWSNTANTDAALRIGQGGVTNEPCSTGNATGGLFSTTLNALDNTQMYYFRAYLTIGGKTFYGDIKEFGIVMVDLGLPSGTKWANVNMGSWKDKDHGDYYAWGETTTKDAFTQGGYKYYNAYTGEYRDLGTDISANDTTDVAHKALRGLWRMPSDDDWRELLTAADYVTWTQDTVSHIPGYRVTSTVNGNSIFLPSNYYDETSRDANYDYETNEESEDYQDGVNHDDDVTQIGFYWSSTRAASHVAAREVKFDNSTTTPPQLLDRNRWRGNSIRPVASTSKIDNTDYEFYLRTEGTTWRYQRDSVAFYSAVLNKPADLETGFVLGRSDGVTKDNADTVMVARPSVEGSGNFYSVIRHNTRNDGVYYYRAYVKLANGTYVYANNVRQFGLTSTSMGYDGLEWANINVDAASPEQIGLNGTPSGKYAGVDPAYAEFGGLWRLPTEEEKQKLLDECTWVESQDGQSLTLYGAKVYKVVNNNDPSKFIYLTSKDPDDWGYRAVAQYNLTFSDNNTVYLRTDSTSWRAGYSGDKLYATLVGSNDVLNRITERGFVIGSSADVTLQTKNTEIATNPVVATAEQISSSAFSGTMSALPNGTHYYRAYVKYQPEGGEEVVYYVDPSDAKTVGLEFVDLGLPSGVKWANVNVGSSVPSDQGDLYAWGDTLTRSEYTQNSYIHRNAKGYVDIGSDISNSKKYDVAAIKIEEARMPSQTEIDELITNATWTSETVNGVEGFRVTGIGDHTANSIFLPLGGYWSSTQKTSDNSHAYTLNEDKTTVNKVETFRKNLTDALRYMGKMIRPVNSIISTIDPENITESGALLKGSVAVADGNRTDVGFELSATSSMTSPQLITKNDIEFDNGNIGPYHFHVANLTPGNLYYYRAYVDMTDGRHYGTVKTISTLSTVNDDNKPSKVDLGLSVLWADRNVDAKLPENMGAYYAWGDITWRASYSTTVYTHNVNNEYVNIGTNISATEWDIANIKYNGCWRMPTQDEMLELRNNCTWTWATKEGVQGYWVESNTSDHQKIFLPAGGYEEENYYTEGVRNKDTDGYYWTATTGTPTGDSKWAVDLHFTSSSRTVVNDGTRHWGYLVRPVYQRNFTWGEGSAARDVYIRTDKITYSDDRNQYTFYGTMLGMESDEDRLTQGFAILTTNADNPTATDIAFTVSQPTQANGAYFIPAGNEKLSQLKVGQRYWVRAYLTDGVNTSYGDAIEMNDYTFFTDSVKWGLGNAGTLYGHTKGEKTEGLQVGFRYAIDNSSIDNITGKLTAGNAKEIAGTFNATDSVFTAQIDTIQVHTYYYQAYTLLNGVYHYGEVKNFGARVVDLGLPSGVKWVDMNLGSDDEEHTGDKYRWGEIVPNQEDTYSVSSGYTFIGGTQYDAAHTRLGAQYRIPSIDNIKELINNCDWTFDTDGWRVYKKGSTDKRYSIFLPDGSYWSSQQGAAANGDGYADAHQISGTTYQTPDALVLRTTLLMLRPVLNTKGDGTIDGGGAGSGTIGDDIEGNE